MTYSTVGLAAVSAFICLTGTAALAGPLPGGATLHKSEVVQVQFRDHGRRFGPPRRICKTEVVRHWVRGGPIVERVQRCRTVR
jgi:hypothetical protein